MRATLTHPQVSSGGRSSLRNWILVALAVAIAILVLVGMVSLGAFFLLREQPFEVPPWEDPVTLVDS